MRETFILPDLTPLLEVSGLNCDKVVIVSIVGKTACNSLGLKVKSIGRVFTAGLKNTDECTIEGSYDEENQIIYLHLHSLLDTDLLIKQYQNLAERCNKDRKCDDFLVINDEIKSNFARALLLLLHISHIVILSHPGWTFDTNYIQYFKAVDNLSQKKLNKICEALRHVDGLSPEWIPNGRLCTPRLIFYFEKCPKGVYNLKKVEHNLEDRIYHILKKTRIISNHGSSLFAIPMNEEFVFISSEQQPVDRLGDAVRGLIQDCQPGGAMQVQAPFCSQPYSERHFLKFLQVHIKQARNKGFNDTGSSSRHQLSQPAHFEILNRHEIAQLLSHLTNLVSLTVPKIPMLPILKHWVESTKALYDVIMKRGLISSLCTDTRFSEQRCLKVLPLALARYQENLPPHYAHAEHDRRLSMALALFNAQARGPVFQQYVTKLKADCKAHWENGRQQCEAASMTGNPCKLPKHSSDQEHMSGFIYKAICDCGRKVGPREDPYNAKQANYLFYQQISRECICLKLERISFPIFQPSIKEYKAATLKETEEALSVLSDRSSELTPENERGLVRQPSTTEYLPGMLTLSSPPGLLPVYSSWSLVCLGPSSLYSHNLGLSDSHHPGFLPSTNYLLPWDVTVYSKAKMNWSHASKYSIRGRRGRPTGASPQFSVKVFIGVEFECSSGHRFMLAAPDKILKATPGSIVKDTGHKIAESDMPLYYPCMMCRANKLAQLMRLHVVTPKAPVHCTLDPKVQPAPGAPIFISTVERPTKLTQSAYWVMRLPYVYVADKEHYPQNLGAKLLQGVFGVTEID